MGKKLISISLLLLIFIFTLSVPAFAKQIPPINVDWERWSDTNHTDSKVIHDQLSAINFDHDLQSLLNNPLTKRVISINGVRIEDTDYAKYAGNLTHPDGLKSGYTLQGPSADPVPQADKPKVAVPKVTAPQPTPEQSTPTQKYENQPSQEQKTPDGKPRVKPENTDPTQPSFDPEKMNEAMLKMNSLPPEQPKNWWQRSKEWIASKGWKKITLFVFGVIMLLLSALGFIAISKNTVQSKIQALTSHIKAIFVRKG